MIAVSNLQSDAQRSALSTPVADPRQQLPSPASGPSPQDIILATRADLAEAQRSRSELEEQLARATTELEKLRRRNIQNGKRISLMENEITHLQLRLKDRDEELREKAKLLEVWYPIPWYEFMEGEVLTPVVLGFPRRDRNI
jgi:peptidoglycan hydrolase CwlO-like protein